MPDIRPTPALAFSKTLNRLKARGLKEVGALARDRTKGWVASGDVLVMFVRDAEATPTEIQGITFREAGPPDAPRYAAQIGTDSATSFEKRLSARSRCFVVDDGERFLHASWVTTAAAWTREVKAYLVPPPGDAYIYESFTRSEARGRGIYPFALKNIIDWGAHNGVTRLWVAVEEHNVPSIRSVTKAGFAEAFRFPFTRRFGRVRVGPASGPDAGRASAFLSRTPPS